MKNQVHHTLLPLTAVLLVLGLSMQVMLHLRQQTALKTTQTTTAAFDAALVQTALLEQSWKASVPAVAQGPETSSGAPAAERDNVLAAALLHLHRSNLGAANISGQVHAVELLMMRSETIFDSLLAPGANSYTSQHQTLVLQAAQPVNDALEKLQENIHTLRQAHVAQYLKMQHRFEAVGLNSLLITVLAFIAFLYFLYQDFRLLRRPGHTAAAVADEAVAMPAAQINASTSDVLAFARGAYRRQLLLEGLSGKGEHAPKMALPVKD